MARIKRAGLSGGTTFSKSKRKVKGCRKIAYADIYPMMPRGYTAVQRAQLRRFERELYAGKRVSVE